MGADPRIYTVRDVNGVTAPGVGSFVVNANGTVVISNQSNEQVSRHMTRRPGSWN